VRLFGSASFILFQTGRMTIVLFLPALALSAVTGIGIDTSIIIMGVLATFYTAMGGIEAVVWTDVLQVAVLVGGALAALVIVFVEVPGGPARVVDVGLVDVDARAARLRPQERLRPAAAGETMEVSFRLITVEDEDHARTSRHFLQSVLFWSSRESFACDSETASPHFSQRSVSAAAGLMAWATAAFACSAAEGTSCGGVPGMIFPGAAGA
jgi:Na+(H+)/acetate symporter ActP